MAPLARQFAKPPLCLDVIRYCKNFLNSPLYSVDVIGHGKSESYHNVRGYIPDYKLLSQSAFDVIEYLIHADVHLSKLPLFLFGQSMCGAMVLEMCLHDKNKRIHGVIVEGAAVFLAHAPPAIFAPIVK
jgi:alpha-beta hydrolase superfamily lysophospholipase